MKLKVKTPASYIILVIFLCIIILFVSVLIGWPFRLEDVFIYLRAAIIGWIVLILLALIGAIFIGMFLSHRILSIGGFTPFEEEMLKMRKDVEAINEKLDALIAQRNAGDMGNKGEDHEVGEGGKED